MDDYFPDENVPGDYLDEQERGCEWDWDADYEPDVDELKEHQDFAQDDDFHNYIEDQFLDGMYEE